MPKSKAQKRRQKEKEKKGKDRNNGTTNSPSSSTTSQSHLTSSNATSPSSPNPSSPKYNGNGRDEIVASDEEIAQRETEKEKKEMEEEQRVEVREAEPESEQVDPAVQTEEEDKEIIAELAETGMESAEPISQGEKEEVEDEGVPGPAVEGDGEKEDEDVAGTAVEGGEEKDAEVSRVEIVEEIKESIVGPIEVVTTELVGPSQGLEAVVEREVAVLESGKVVEVTAAENLEKPLEEQAAEAHETTRQFPVTAAKHATWWNCCGLLDVFSGSSH